MSIIGSQTGISNGETKAKKKLSEKKKEETNVSFSIKLLLK